MNPSGNSLTIQPEAPAIAFGTVFTSNMLCASYADGAWSDFTVRPLQNYTLHPASLVLHYGQTIFEGMKAYRRADGSVSLFRPQFNAARLNRSAHRMAIPPVDEEAFLEALIGYVDTEREHIPERPGSLYLRPTIFASEAAIGVRAAETYELFVIAMPVGSYFAGHAAGSGSVEIFVSETVARAAPGGTGAVKAGANYGITLKTIDDAKEKGSSQVLFLDSGGRRLIEEAGGMNLFVVRGKQLITPPLSGTILGGCTRDSLLKLGASLGYEVKEAPLSIDTVISEVRQGIVSEVFLCGTAAVVVSVNTLHMESGEHVTIGKAGNTPVADQLRDQLTGIQFGSYEDPYGWVVPVP